MSVGYVLKHSSFVYLLVLHPLTRELRRYFNNKERKAGRNQYMILRRHVHLLSHISKTQLVKMAFSVENWVLKD